MSELETAGGVDRRKLICLRIGEQEFCVDIMAVREIRGWTEATALPQAPAFVRGLINLRGVVLPIVDLAVRFGLPPSGATARNVIIVVQIGTQQVGLLVDEVSDILTATDDSIQPTPDLGSDTAKEFVRGLIAIDGRMICLISLDHVLPVADLEAA